MKRFIALSAGFMAIGAAVGKECDKICRQKCIDGDLGDDCVQSCGCETLTNGVADAFGDQ
jgi:hypothetical protein